MVHTLEIVDGHYRETVKWQEDGVVHKKRTNSKKKITEDMHELSEAITKCIVANNQLKIYYESGNVLILKDYQRNAKKYLLFREKVTELKHFEHLIPMIVREKVTTFHKTRLAALLLAGSMAFSSLGSLAIQPQIGMNRSSITIAEKGNLTLKDSPIEIVDIHTFPMPAEEIAMEEPVESPIIKEESLEERLEHVQQIQANILNNSEVLPIGTKLTAYAINRLVKFINSTEGSYAFQYGEQFGVDPYILIALAMQESSLISSATNGYAYGLYQLESPEKPRTITATNVLTGEKEKMTITMETAKNAETNTKIAAMMLQNYLNKYDHNIYMAIQCYNFGEGVVSLAVSKYADRIGVPKDIVISNYEDFGWLEDIQAISEHPHDYVTEEDREKYKDVCGAAMRYLDNWPYTRYGDGKYIEHVLSYYIGTVSEIKSLDKTTVISLVTNEFEQMPAIDDERIIS